MDPESKKLLEDTFNLARENNNMLHKIRKVQKWASFWSGLRVIIIIGVALGSFYFLEPYINKVISVWNAIYGGQPQQNSTNSTYSTFQDFLKKVSN